MFVQKECKKKTSFWHALKQEFHPAATYLKPVLALWLMEVDAIY